MPARKYTREYLAPLVEKAINFSDLIRLMGASPSGSIIALLTQRVDEYGLDHSHFKRFITSPFHRRRDPAEVFATIKTNRMSRGTLGGAMRADGIPYICAVCGLGPEWQGKRLTLQIDHVDGNRLNNAKVNLRFICPNCHTQTKTYGAARQKKPLVKTECAVCRAPLLVTPKRSRGRCCCGPACFTRLGRHPERPKWPGDDELSQRIWGTSVSEVSRALGVSEASVRRRCKLRGLKVPPKGHYRPKHSI